MVNGRLQFLQFTSVLPDLSPYCAKERSRGTLGDLSLSPLQLSPNPDLSPLPITSLSVPDLSPCHRRRKTLLSLTSLRQDALHGGNPSPSDASFIESVRFFGSYNVTVTGITIRNSPQFHLKFDTCQSVEVYGITISSPGDSPNTDGIHLQNSAAVTIHHFILACGDDCISIQTGCSNVFVHDISCGPDHGISIGGLGKDGMMAVVSGITVENINMTGTMQAARIKIPHVLTSTWPISSSSR